MQLTVDEPSGSTHQMPIRASSGFFAPSKSWIRPSFLERPEDVDGQTRVKRSSTMRDSPKISPSVPVNSAFTEESPQTSLSAGNPSTLTRYKPTGTQTMMKEWLQKAEQKSSVIKESPKTSSPPSLSMMASTNPTGTQTMMKDRLVKAEQKEVRPKSLSSSTRPTLAGTGFERVGENTSPKPRFKAWGDDLLNPGPSDDN
eukprot:gene21500-28481_t